jgi:type IV pilus assembly protein PilO
MLDLFKGKITPVDWAVAAGIAAVTILLCLGFYAGVFMTQQSKLANLNKQLTDIRGQLKTAYDIKTNSEALQSEVNKMDDLVSRFQNRLPDEREIPQLLRKFEALGDSIGLRVELLAQPTFQDSNKETIPYKVTARGNFHQIASFINLLERDERYLKVSDIDIGEQDAGVSECTFTLSTFRFIQSTSGAETQPPTAGEKK